MRSSEDWRLRLALIKENSAYRKGWQEFGGEKYLKASNAIQEYYIAGGSSNSNELWDACEQELKALTNFYGFLYRFEIDASGLRVNIKGLKDKILDALNPHNTEIPKRLPIRFTDKPPIMGVELEGHPISFEIGCSMPISALQRYFRPSERLLLVDLSRKKGELIEAFKTFLDNVDGIRKYEEMPKSWKDNYEQWGADTSRFRKEAWKHLEVWRLRRKRIPFAQIAATLNITHDNAKKSFYRAYELIEGKSYDPDYYRNQYKTIAADELKKTCHDCPDRKTCTDPCPDVLTFIDQDYCPLREPSGTAKKSAYEEPAYEELDYEESDYEEPDEDNTPQLEIVPNNPSF